MYIDTSLSLQSLPEDVLIEILSHVSVETVLRLRQTCKKLARITRGKHVWLNVLHNELATQRFTWPNYLRPMSTLAEQEFEPFAAHLVRLNMARHSEYNVPGFSELHRTRSVTWVRLIRGRWLVAAESDAEASILSIWELKTVPGETKQMSPVYEASFEGPVVAGLLDVRSGTSPVLALELRPARKHVVEIVQLRQSGDNIACVRLARYEGVSRLRDLHGSLLAFAVHDGRSLATIIDWRTGNIRQLVHNPEITGGVIAMKVQGSVVAVISPRKLRIFRFNFGNTNALESNPNHVHTLPLNHSIGFATLQFYPSTLHPGSATLYAALSGKDGTYVYTAEMHTLISKPYVNAAQLLTCVWRKHESPSSSCEYGDMPFQPLLGSERPTLSWLVGPQARAWPSVHFATMSGGLSAAENISLPFESLHIDSRVFKLKHYALPALYARGVYDYDETLGLVVFGNTFGELCVFNLANSDIESLQVCLEPLLLPEVDFRDDLLQHNRVEFSCPPYLLFAIPPELTESLAQKADMVSQWLPLQPQELQVPPGWYREATDPAIMTSRLPFRRRDTWIDYIPTYRSGETDIAWTLEHSLRFYGDPVPLARDDYAHVFESGGLLLLWDPEGQEVRVAPHGTTLEQVMAPEGLHFLNTVLKPDRVADTAGSMYWDTWEQEHGECGRNRWRELEQRGGVVDPLLFELDPWPRWCTDEF